MGTTSFDRILIPRLFIMDVQRFLHVRPVRKIEHFHFNLFNYFLFKNSEGTELFLQAFYRCPLFAVPYILGVEAVFFRRKRFLVELNGQPAGMFVVSERPDSLYISSLAVSPAYRRLRIGTYIVDYVDKMCKSLRKEWLELGVLKTNGPALRLYKKLGFKVKRVKKWTLVLRKRSKLSS